ncbi:hypothetical protein F2Q70_00017241 [Brassica cretica]|uniref:Uncharacterized protein n=1 Tax=Brassica cretica TaxID=69181 RepID=A0A8S9I484_BRACR|nr:hypothetical protein F2Q70_00017241 [Brassica cretica]
MICNVGWCLIAVLSIFSREVGSVLVVPDLEYKRGGRLGASQVGSVCCIWISLPSGSLVGDGGRYICTVICEGLVFNVGGVQSFLFLPVLGVLHQREHWWLMYSVVVYGSIPFFFAVALPLVVSLSVLPLQWGSHRNAIETGVGSLLRTGRSRSSLMQVLKLGFLMLSPLSLSFCSEARVFDVVPSQPIVLLGSLLDSGSTGNAGNSVLIPSWFPPVENGIDSAYSSLVRRIEPMRYV